MGGGKKQKAPAAPDYAALQQSDALANRQTASEITRWNRPTQIDAYGNSINWSQDAAGNWTQSQTLNPYFSDAQNTALWNSMQANRAVSEQGAFSGGPGYEMANNRYWNAITNGLQGNQGGELADFAPDAGGIGDFTNTAGTIGNFDRTQGDQVAKDMFESAMSRLRPQQEQDTAAIDVKLRQQGLQPGTEAYDRAMKNMTTSQGDVNAKLGLDSTAAGYQAAQNIYNTNLGGQGQRYQQLQGDYAANLAGQGQRFGQQQAAYETNQGAQQQRYQQGKELFDANQEERWKEYDRSMTSQQQQYNQALQNYTLPMERAQAAAQLYAQSPQPNFPGFSGATGYNPADMTGAANASYQAKMGNANAGANKKNSMLGAGTSLGSAYLGSK